MEGSKVKSGKRKRGADEGRNAKKAERSQKAKKGKAKK